MADLEVPVLKFLFRNEWKPLTEAIGSSPAYGSESFNTAVELMTYLESESAGMVVVSLRDKNDLLQIATLIKLSKKKSPASLVKVIVVNFSGDKQFEKAIAKLGILDLVEERIAIKPLRFKVDLMMKSIKAHLKKAPNVPEKNHVFKKDGQSNNTDTENFEKEKEKFQNLEGHAKTDNLKSGPLSGNVIGDDNKLGGPLSGKGSTSHINTDPMGMDVNPDDNKLGGSLSGKGQTSQLNTNPMSMDLQSQDHEADAPLSGPGKTSRINAKPLSLDIYPEENKLAELLGVNPTKEKSSDPLEMDSKTDHQKFYKNHNKTEKFDAKDFLGYSSTDELEKHLFSAIRTNKVIEPVETEADMLEQSIETATVTSLLTQGNVKVDCELNDHFEETFIFTTINHVFTAEMPVTLNLNFHYLKKDTPLKFEGTITQIDTDDEGLQYLTVKISKANVSEFNSFMKLYGTRQNNINNFLKTVKGY